LRPISIPNLGDRSHYVVALQAVCTLGSRTGDYRVCVCVCGYTECDYEITGSNLDTEANLVASC